MKVAEQLRKDFKMSDSQYVLGDVTALYVVFVHHMCSVACIMCSVACML